MDLFSAVPGKRNRGNDRRCIFYFTDFGDSDHRTVIPRFFKESHSAVYEEGKEEKKEKDADRKIKNRGIRIEEMDT